MCLCDQVRVCPWLMFPIFVCLFILVFASWSSAQDETLVDPDPKGYASGVVGNVMILDPETDQSRALQDSDPIYEGSRITADEDAYAELELLDGSDVHVDELTQADITKANVDAAAANRDISLSILYGALKISAAEGFSKRSTFTVTTPVSVSGVRGTEFSVGYESDDASSVDVFDGAVAVSQDGTEESVKAGESSEAVRGRGIRKLALTEDHRDRWDQVQEAVNLRRQQDRERFLQDRLDRVRAENPDDPRIESLERDLHDAGNDRTASQERFEALRKKMSDWRRHRMDKMRDFAKIHGRAKFEIMRKFRGGKLTVDQREKAIEKMRARRQDMRDRNDNIRNDRRQKLQNRMQDRREEIRDRKQKQQEQITPPRRPMRGRRQK